MQSIRLSVTFLAVFFTFVGTTPAQTRAWTPELQVKVRVPGSPGLSPDRKQVVFSVSEAVMTADKSEYVSQLWIANSDGTGVRQLTFGDRSSGNPKWSPDGSAIAFTSSRGNGRNNIYLLRLAGGDPEMITDVKTGVAEFAFSPDGKSMAFTMADAKSDEEEKNDKGRNDHRWVDENAKVAKLYVVRVAKDAEGRREARRLTSVQRHVSGFDWSPDGSKIALSHVSSPVADFWNTADVSVVDVASGSLTDLAVTASAENAPSFSPDGKWIAVVASDFPARWARRNNIVVYPSAGGIPVTLPDSFDSQPSLLGWSPDSANIWFSETRKTGTGIYQADVRQRSIREFFADSGVSSGIEVSADSKSLTMVRQSSNSAPEVYVMNAADRSVKRVSDVNAEFAAIPAGRTEVISWKSPDGRVIEGLLSYPTDHRPGTKVPLLLNVHGGPAGTFQDNFLGGRSPYGLASFLSNGFAVLRPNPRGSSGYGVEFRRANIRDWAGRDYEDLMSGVDEVVRMGVADPERLGVMGWSYGGYMTSMVITKTSRFKAASAGAPVTNMMSFVGTADIPSFIPDYFEAEYWNDPAVYSKHSAMFNIKNARTPTLIQHGESDIRVPISQGYELHTALKRLGVPTRMVVFPRQPHGIQEPKHHITAMQSNLDWFNKYVK